MEQEKFLKIDPHTHSKGISLCSIVDVKEIIDKRRTAGYDGIVLTNHCQPWYYPAEEHKNYVERVIEEYLRAKAYGEEVGVRVYLGLEVTTLQSRYADWLLYGVTEDFLRSTPCLYACTQQELFALCEEAGILMIQAHPYRGEKSPSDPRYMHGVEINCTDGDIQKKSLVEEFAAKNNLLVTCGTDFHGREGEVMGGIFLPSSCVTAVELAAHLRESEKCYFITKRENFKL